jgi:charged multivesicular body protein 4
VRREHAADVVVFGTLKNDQKQGDSSLKTRLTLHDLEYAASQVQERIDTTLEKRDISTQRALAAQRKKNSKLAVAEMKRRKLYEQTLCNAYATLEKLEQVRMTLETAVHQRDELQMLGQATEALKTMHLETSLEQVDDVLDDWQEEQEHVTRVSDTLAAAMLPAVDDNSDDDELMKELEALTLGDKNDKELMKELEALTVGDKNGKKEAKADGSTGMPTKEEISKSDEEETSNKAEVPSSPIPVAL